MSIHTTNRACYQHGWGGHHLSLVQIDRRGAPGGYPHQCRYTQQMVPINDMGGVGTIDRYTQQMVPIIDIGAGRAREHDPTSTLMGWR
jgi:hypothetical protein